jgi:hypothetical protein
VIRRRVILVLVVASIVGGLWWNQDRGLKAVATETHAALCAFKTDLEGRTADAEKYLKDVEAGRREPIAGITNQEIKDSIRNRRATLRSLQSLRC